MFLRTALAAAVALTAGSALAADVTRPIITPPAPVFEPAPSLTGDLLLGIGAWGVGGGSVGLFDALGRVNVPLQGGLNLEVEAGAEAYWWADGYSHVAYADAVAHLWGTHSATTAWGLYSGVIFASGPPTSWVGGVEAKHFFQSGSLGASAGFLYCSSCSTQALGVFTASLNHYLSPNTRVGLRGGLLTDFSDVSWEVRADIEHRFMHPISLFAEGGYARLPFTSDGFWSVRGGVRFYLDAPNDTIQSHERKVPWTYWLPGAYFGG